MEFLLDLGLFAIFFMVMWLTLNEPSGRRRVHKLVNGKWIWVNGFDSDVEFVHDPRDPAGKLRPEDYHMLEREAEAPLKADQGEAAK